MPAKRQKTPNSGRKKGVPNKATASAREAIGMFVEANASRLQEWLDKVAETNPEKAFHMLRSMLEYHVPKLAKEDMPTTQGMTFVTMGSVIIDGKALKFKVGSEPDAVATINN